MKTKHRMILVCSILVGALLACTLPGNQPDQGLFPPTPNATMTELYAQATLLTPDFSQPQFATFTPTSTQGAVVISPTATNITADTATVTSTAGITLTYTPPSTVTPSTPKRPVGNYTAKFLSTPPTIDGDWADWNTTQFPLGGVVYGLGEWENSDDLEGSFRIGWDNNYLYLAVKVRDDVYVQKATGVEIYKGDSLEILLDTDLYNDFYTTSLSPDDYQLGISPGNPDTNGTKEAYLWYPSTVAGARPQVVIKAVGGSGLYRVEAAIPWSVFGVAPSSGRHFGFSLSINDNDNTSSNVQQSMVSSASTRKLTNPTTWGELVLSN